MKHIFFTMIADYLNEAQNNLWWSKDLISHWFWICRDMRGTRFRSCRRLSLKYTYCHVKTPTLTRNPSTNRIEVKIIYWDVLWNFTLMGDINFPSFLKCNCQKSRIVVRTDSRHYPNRKQPSMPSAAFIIHAESQQFSPERY